MYLDFLVLADVIFFIYLYQRYIYRVDPTRVNEFGVSQEMLEENGSAIKDKEDSSDVKENSDEKSNQKKDASVKEGSFEGKTLNGKEDKDNTEETADSKGDNKDKTPNENGDIVDENGDEDSADSEVNNEEDEVEKLPDPKPIAEKKND